MAWFKDDDGPSHKEVLSQAYRDYDRVERIARTFDLPNDPERFAEAVNKDHGLCLTWKEYRDR